MIGDTTPQPVSPIDATASGFQAKAATNKSGLTPLGNITVSPTQSNELLANMQQLVNQKATVDPDRLIFSGGPVHNTIMNSFKDAAAWASGGAKGPTEGLALRDAEKAREAKDLFEMRTKMAEIKAAQDQAAANAARVSANLKTGDGAVGTGAGMTYAGVPVPLAVQAQIKDLSPNEQLGYLNKWLETQMSETVKANLNPAANEQKPYAFGGDIGTVYLTSNQFNALPADVRARVEKATLAQFGADALTPSAPKTDTSTAPVVKGVPVSLDLVSADPTLRRIGAGESNLQNVPNAAGASNAYGLYQIVPSTFDLVKTKSPEFKDITWEQFKADPKIQTAVAEKLLAENDKIMDQRKVEKNDLNRYSVWFSGDTKLATAPADTPVEKIMSAKEIAANKLGGKTVGQVRDMLQANLDRGDKVLATAKTATDISKAKAELRNDLENPQPGVQVASTSKTGLPGGMPNPKDYRVPGAYEAALQAWKEGQIAGSKEMAKTGEEQRKEFETDINPNTIIENDTMSKRMQTIVKEAPQIAGVINRPGYDAAVARLLKDGIGSFGGIKGLEDAIFQTLPETTQKEIGRRSELITYLAQMELRAAKLIKGQGQITEGEREILQRASASISDPAELIYKKARILEIANKKNEALAKIYGNAENFSNFRNFQNDERFVKVMEKYRAELNNAMNEEVNFRQPKVGKTQISEGTEKVSKSGKPIVFRNGQWEYK